jgi:hypothetical protein
VSAWAELVKAKAPVAINNPVKIEQILDIALPLRWFIGAAHFCAFWESRTASHFGSRKSRYRIAAECGRKAAVNEKRLNLLFIVNAIQELRQ